MSKTPVKAALERLESERLDSASQHQKIIDCEMAGHELANRPEIWLALESFVLRNIAGKLKEFDISSIRTDLM